MKKFIEIELKDEENVKLEIGKVVEINTSKENDGRIYLEEMNNGKWRLLYSGNLIKDIKKLKGFKIIRED